MIQFVVTAVVAVALGYLAYKVGGLLFKVDEGVEDIKRNLIRIGQKASSLHMYKLSAFCEDVVVGDDSEIIHKTKDLLNKVAISETFLASEIDVAFNAVLEAKLATQAGRAAIAARLAEYETVKEQGLYETK